MNTMFQLPIQYVDHSTLDTTVMQDLELIDVHGLEPICDKVFNPRTDESKRIARMRMQYYTTHTTFLKESVELFKTSLTSSPIDAFTTKWSAMKNNKEFRTTYHYIESKWLSNLNYSSMLLFFISVYFVSSPIVCVLTPLIMILVPFAILSHYGTPLTWTTYYEMFKKVAVYHSLGKLAFQFGNATPDKKMYLIMGAAFFGLQVYANVYNFYTFYKNMTHTMVVLKDTEHFLKHTIASMRDMEEAVSSLSTYTLFGKDVGIHRAKLEAFYKKISPVHFSLSNVGILRAHFYELYDNPELNESLHYAIDFHGYLQNHVHMHKQMKKKMKACTFGTKTVLKRAYYPISKPVKNSYDVKNMILTGPNASGKTTLIKSTMINVLLSQQMGCGFYRSATICPYDTFFSYINIPDTSGRDSLFQAEARRCKDIIDHVSKNQRTLCIFDELFSGTNPKEATASTVSLLSYLSDFPSFTFLLTTHFTDVCEQAKVSLFRMKTDIHPLKYHYTMEKGISYVRGGAVVLENMGFPETILKHSAMCG